MPTCKECGSPITKGAKFCPECGAPAGSKSKAMPELASTDGKTLRRTGEPVYGVLNLEDLPLGHIIDERYEIKEKLGQGGFGAVYRAYDRIMEVDKALKVIPEAVANDEEAMADLQQEARTMIALEHPKVVRVYDFHHIGEIKYIDMAYIDGKTLTKIKLECPDRRVPEEQVLELAVQIAEGLAYAHNHGVIHKDIKPQNVMVTGETQVKIMDFGIAEKVRSSMSRVAQTSSSGTLVYMSPEQLRGKKVGNETDIYSFGAVLYELLSGHPPFYKGDIQYQILNEMPENLQNISSKLNAIVIKCLEKDYKERFGSFEEVLSSLSGKLPVFAKPRRKVSHRVKRQYTTVVDFHFGVIDGVEIIINDLDELSNMLEKYTSHGKVHLYKGTIQDWVKDIDQAIYAGLRSIVEDEYRNDQTAGLIKALYLISPGKGFKTPRGIECWTKEDLGDAIELEASHYEQELSNLNADLFLYLEARGHQERVKELRRIVQENDNRERALSTIVLNLQGKDALKLDDHTFEKPEELLNTDDSTKFKLMQLLQNPHSKLSIWLERFGGIEDNINKWRELERYTRSTLPYALAEGSPFYFLDNPVSDIGRFKERFSKYILDKNHQVEMATIDGPFVEEADFWLREYHDFSYQRIIIEYLREKTPEGDPQVSSILVTFILDGKPDIDYYWRDVAPIVERFFEEGRLAEDVLEQHRQFLGPHVAELQSSYDDRIAALRECLREMTGHDFRVLREENDLVQTLLENLRDIIAKSESQKIDGPYERAQDLLGMVTRGEEHLEELSRLRTKARDLVESIAQEKEQAMKDAIQKYEELRRVRKSLAQARWKGTGEGLKLGLGWGLLGGILFGLGGCCYSCVDSGFKTGSPGAGTGFLIGAAIFGIIAFVYGYYQVAGEIDRFTTALRDVGMEKNKLERKIAELQSSLP